MIFLIPYLASILELSNTLASHILMHRLQTLPLCKDSFSFNVSITYCFHTGTDRDILCQSSIVRRNSWLVFALWFFFVQKVVNNHLFPNNASVNVGEVSVWLVYILNTCFLLSFVFLTHKTMKGTFCLYKSTSCYCFHALQARWIWWFVTRSCDVIQCNWNSCTTVFLVGCLHTFLFSLRIIMHALSAGSWFVTRYTRLYVWKKIRIRRALQNRTKNAHQTFNLMTIIIAKKQTKKTNNALNRYTLWQRAAVTVTSLKM